MQETSVLHRKTELPRYIVYKACVYSRVKQRFETSRENGDATSRGAFSLTNQIGAIQHIAVWIVERARERKIRKRTARRARFRLFSSAISRALPTIQKGTASSLFDAWYRTLMRSIA